MYLTRSFLSCSSVFLWYPGRAFFIAFFTLSSYIFISFFVTSSLSSSLFEVFPYLSNIFHHMAQSTSSWRYETWFQFSVVSQQLITYLVLYQVLLSCFVICLSSSFDGLSLVRVHFEGAWTIAWDIGTFFFADFHSSGVNPDSNSYSYGVSSSLQSIYCRSFFFFYLQYWYDSHCDS